MAIARRRESVLENERAESLLAGPRRRERDRNGAREREKNGAGRSARGRRGRKRKRHQPRAAGKEGTRGRSGARKGKEKTGRRTKEAAKYRRRTAVGIKRGDGRRCGGPTLFPVEDWTAAAPLRRPSCPPTSSFLPSSCSFFFSSSSSSPRVCVRARSRGVRARSSRPPISAYLISYFLTYSRSSRSRERERRAVSALPRPLVAPDDAATRHAARPRTMLDRIILAGPLC